MVAVTRVSVIGGGDFGAEHIEAYRALPDVDLVAIVEPDAGRRAHWERALEGEGIALHASIDALLEVGDIQAASIVTPGATHAPTSRALMEAGVDVLVEKPFADTVEAALEIREVAQRTGRVCVPGHVMRHDPAHARLRARIDSPVAAVSLRRDRSSTLTERFPGVHPAILTGVHDIDLALWFTDERVVRVTAGDHRGGAGVDAFTATLLHEGGAVSTVQGAYLLPREDATAVDDEVRVYGCSTPLTLASASQGRSRLRRGADNLALMAELLHFLDCVRSATPSQLCTPNDAVHVVEIADAIVRSAADGGSPITLDPRAK